MACHNFSLTIIIKRIVRLCAYVGVINRYMSVYYLDSTIIKLELASPNKIILSSIHNITIIIWYEKKWK